MESRDWKAKKIEQLNSWRVRVGEINRPLPKRRSENWVGISTEAKSPVQILDLCFFF